MNTALIKQAFRLGYEHGLATLEKRAAGYSGWIRPVLQIGGRTAGRTGRFRTAVRNAVSMASGAGRRYSQLLRGGNQALVGQYVNTIRGLDNVLKLPRYRGTWVHDVARNAKSDLRASRFGLAGNPFETNIVHGVKITPEMRNELNKVLAARAGTATVGTVALGHMAGIPNSAIDDSSGRFQSARG